MGSRRDVRNGVVSTDRRKVSVQFTLPQTKPISYLSAFPPQHLAEDRSY
jgi:hypothetical protein